jgi:hypothetical protein
VFQRWLFWPLFALLMGFVMGGSIFWGLYGPNTTIDQANAAYEQQARHEEPRSKRDETDEAVARYTLWLMVFTGILAVATVGLGIATVGLYLTGEKQIGLVQEASAAQARDMKDSVKAAQDSVDVAKRSASIAERALTLSDRPWVDFRIEITGALKFDAIEGCLIKIRLILENIGRSPAIGMGYFVELCTSIPQAVERHRKMVDSARWMIKETSFGNTRFPGQPLEIETVLRATLAQIEAGTKENESGLVEPYIVACVYYGLPTGGRFRYTSINKAIWTTDEAEGFAPVGEYPVEKMSLSSINTGEIT